MLEGEITPTKALHAYQFKVAKENQTINFMCEPIMEAKVSIMYNICVIKCFPKPVEVRICMND